MEMGSVRPACGSPREPAVGLYNEREERVTLDATTMKWHCPICRKATDSESDKDFPFCSERCRLMDLGNWASEKYKISEPAADESMPESGKSPARDESEN